MSIFADQNPDPIRYRAHSWKLHTWVEREEPLGEGDKYYDPNTGDLVQIAGPSGMEIPELPPIEEGPVVDEDVSQPEEQETKPEEQEPSPSEQETPTSAPITYSAEDRQIAGSGGALEPRHDEAPSPQAPSGTSDRVREKPTDIDIAESPLTQPPVDDNLTGAAAREFGQEPSLGGAAKGAMARTAAGDIDVSELRARVRTQQAVGGLSRGGAAAKQEASIVGRYKQGRQIESATQLADLTQAESEIGQKIQQFIAQTESTTAKTALSQLLSPIGAYGELVQGSQAGLAGIYGLGRVL